MIGAKYLHVVEELHTVSLRGEHPVVSIFFIGGVLVDFRGVDHRLRKVLKNRYENRQCHLLMVQIFYT